jgi:hypothetical protein
MMDMEDDSVSEARQPASNGQEASVLAGCREYRSAAVR